ncbi:hypothetical protein CHARACLAT_029584 [Characodon lateralis]|uniref:Uncharacterized protein n=1 Tax=Characodon lateralis TaxID=208331 RepID=A0ABU7CWD6_9TELE|nr:hypothetical protein [Characodon lateralis]
MATSASAEPVRSATNTLFCFEDVSRSHIKTRGRLKRSSQTPCCVNQEVVILRNSPDAYLTYSVFQFLLLLLHFVKKCGFTLAGPVRKYWPEISFSLTDPDVCFPDCPGPETTEVWGFSENLRGSSTVSPGLRDSKPRGVGGRIGLFISLASFVVLLIIIRLKCKRQNSQI